MARLDRSSETIVVYCPYCPQYTRLFMKIDEFAAHREACAHENAHHPESKSAKNARRFFEKKAA
ncbi:hypothetical protein ASF48_07015 [Rathayibacter sp. Leaf299]|uniref:hypothetical protein n=1 Tax=Rathayibacter sp. Leaf299 TaxID=1736328 RepID=UPI0006F6F5D2|nr:hypothetical protein [Rathayibacter sp. Leaf299]KQQ22881.1 hypothetical protein ASF48_07015 [Rathayibacter sp. Leaf299]